MAETGDEGLAAFERDGADLVLLDLMLPGHAGHRGLPPAAGQRSRVPIIMLTAKDGEVDKVVGLELGADDYVTKPYSVRELVARIRAVLRRGEEADGATATRWSRPARCGWTWTGTWSRSTAAPWPCR